MRASVLDDHRRTFRTDIERMTDGHLRWTPLDMIRSTNTQAVFRGAAPKGPHTATDASLSQYLQDRLASENIHLDLSVSIER
ncbi:hypothetical protein ASG92_12855 [Arthrobacter sp. Soil736]|nr:hypothetical protein ASG92_12855 [Arthrobacter sp. Soil736]